MKLYVPNGPETVAAITQIAQEFLVGYFDLIVFFHFLVTVNTDALAIEVYRVGDRGLAAQIQDGEFLRRMNSTDIEQLKERTGAQVYKGELVVQNKLNDEVTTAFPVSEAIGTLKPGAYVLSAHALPKKGENDRQAIQWFIVSDLGLTTYTGDDGVHAFVRSLATAAPVANATMKLIARNNEVLGTATTDQRGYARFDAGLKRGEGGLAPAMLTAETAAGADFSHDSAGWKPIHGEVAVGHPIDVAVFCVRSAARLPSRFRRSRKSCRY